MPQILKVGKAWVTPQVLDTHAGLVRGAVYDADGNLLPSSLRDIDREEGLRIADPTELEFGERAVGKYQMLGADMAVERAIYCGHTFGGWGHSITESLGSIWPDPIEYRNIPLLFQPWGRTWESASARFSVLVKLAGYTANPIIVSSGLTMVSELLLPDRLLNLDKIIYGAEPVDKAMNAVYRRIVSNAAVDFTLAADGPVFLSRGPGHRRAEPFEMELETLFREAGFLIFRGWETSVPEQVARIAASSTIVGLSGSALHNSVFAKQGATVLEILDTRELEFAARRNSVQQALCDLRGQRYVGVDPTKEIEVGGVGALFRRVMELLDGM